MHTFNSKIIQAISEYDSNPYHAATKTVKAVADNLVYSDKETCLEKVNYLAKHANDALLIHLAQKLAKEKWTLKLTPEIFSPLTKRILKMSPEMQKRLFRGNAEPYYDISRRPPIHSEYEVYNAKRLMLYTDIDNDKLLNIGDFGMARLIHKIHLKHEWLLKRDEESAAKEALSLYGDLNKYYQQYLSSEKNKERFKTYTDNVKTRIDAARPVLEKHRGWKNFFANVLMHIGLLVTTAGIGNIAAFSYAYSKNNKHLMFNLCNTDFANKTNALLSHLDESTNIPFPEWPMIKPF